MTKEMLQGGHGATIGAQLRRLSERIDRDVGLLYGHLGVAFEQRWFGVLNQIVQNGAMTVGDLAAALRITHVSVSQSVRSLEAVGYVRSAPDPKDGRRRPLSLTAKGETLVQTLTPFWLELNREAEALNREVGDIARYLDRLDVALTDRSLFDRVRARIDKVEAPGRLGEGAA